jgi:probable F420-dependent oxidoreductase
MTVWGPGLVRRSDNVAIAKMPRVAVTLGLWQDRPAEEALTTARVADALGFNELWIGEMATYDAFVLATHIGSCTDRIGFVIGPLAVSVRDPVSIAMGAASVAALTGRPVGVAVGTSSEMLVEQWHGRKRMQPSVALRESLLALRPLLRGEKVSFAGEVVRTSGYRLRLPAPNSTLSAAAFGPSAVRAAARLADRMVLNLTTPASAARLIEAMRAGAEAAGRSAPRVALWAPAAVDPDEEARHQLRRAVVSYLAAAGYREMFEKAGHAELVALALRRPHPGELLAAIPDSLVEEVGLVGRREQVRERLAAYARAGVDEVAVAAASTSTDPAGGRTLEVVRALAEPTTTLSPLPMDGN